MASQESGVTISEHPDAQFRLSIPDNWETDTSGSDKGVFVYQDPTAWGGRFHPNVVVIQRPYDNRHETEDDYYKEVLATDAGLAEQLTQYRNVHLGWDTLGDDDTPAVLRVSSYRNEEGTPLMLYQWNAVRSGIEINFAVTFPTAFYQEWANPAWLWSKDFEWTV